MPFISQNFFIFPRWYLKSLHSDSHSTRWLTPVITVPGKSGPYKEFSGCVSEAVSKINKIKQRRLSFSFFPAPPPSLDNQHSIPSLFGFDHSKCLIFVLCPFSFSDWFVSLDLIPSRHSMSAFPPFQKPSNISL